MRSRATQTGLHGPGRREYDLGGRAEEEAALERRPSRYCLLIALVTICGAVASYNTQDVGCTAVPARNYYVPPPARNYRRILTSGSSRTCQ